MPEEFKGDAPPQERDKSHVIEKEEDRAFVAIDYVTHLHEISAVVNEIVEKLEKTYTQTFEKTSSNLTPKQAGKLLEKLGNLAVIKGDLKREVEKIAKILE